MDINCLLLFHHHNRSDHFWVNRAEVGIGAGSTSCNREGLIRVQRDRFLKLLLDAHHCVRFLISIDPCDLFTRFDRQCLWIEGEVFDLYFVLLVAVAIGVFHLASEREGGQSETADSAH
jgi:hypothetical protein